MEKSRKGKINEIAKHNITTFREIVMGFIPGSHVVDSFLSYRSNLKQKRLITFVEQLQKVFATELDYNLEDYNFETEDFVDMLDSVLMKVTETKSEIKLVRYRNLLAKQIIAPVENNVINNYIRLVNDLNEIELIILDRVPKIDARYYSGLSEQHLIMKIAQVQLEKVNDVSKNGFNIEINDQIIFVSGNELFYYLNSLVSKGLLSKSQTGISRVISPFGGKNLEHIYLPTKMSIAFLEFLQLFKPE